MLESVDFTCSWCVFCNGRGARHKLSHSGLVLLGVMCDLTMDTNLNWKRHSENICNKCTKMIGILNRLKYVLPLGIKIMLYNYLILPHINYCSMAWGYKGIRLLKIQKKSCSHNNIKWIQYT